MYNRNAQRVRRARKTRARIAEQAAARLTVHRSNCHIYAQVIDASGAKVLAAASTVEPEARKAARGSNVKAAAEVGRRIAERAKQLGIEAVAFDRAGYKFHGRVKALAEAAREAGLKF
ncbi:MAG TPA: 50S ribosomal protein L18 [Steroidobacteraceae bacterium]|nr:50S ribosomal protein L18 [Steroidobacteraceae bacterium]